MQFRVLGPLEVLDGDRVVGLGGTRQRATLGFLLLHLNQVVATSRLLGALWPDEPPASARKILQNAIWGLRSALSAPAGTAESATLLTQAPGYMLSADPARVDLHQFHWLAEQGRGLLASGDFEHAGRALCQALDLWRGPALVDLVEAGLAWRELGALESLRLDVLEDYFEAELACGRHTVLADLERMVEANPLRERSCGQLMLALYRCGRQADALTVFSRVRAELVEKLGLEPRRELQVLQHAILTHDQALMETPATTGESIRVRAEPRRPNGVLQPAGVGASPVAVAGPVPPDLPVPAPAPGPVNGSGPDPADDPRTIVSAVPPAEPKQVSVLMVHTAVELRDEAGRFEVLDGIARTVRESVEYFTGIVVASIGSVTMALFDMPGELDNGVERAAWAALAVRDCLDARLRTVPGARVVLRSAVTVGQAGVRYQVTEGGASLSVNGLPVEECQSVLDAVPDGETWLSDAARGEAERTVLCHPVVGHPGLWRLDRVLSEWAPYDHVPVVDREHELELLRRLMDRARHRSTPHLVTVLGEAGVGKTRFLMEFQRRVVRHPANGARVVVAPAGPDQDGVRAVLAGSVASCCGVTPHDDAAAVRDRLGATATRYLPPERASAVADRLLGLLVPGHRHDPTTTDELTGAWRELIGAVARDDGMALVVDDLHHADDRLLAFVDGLAGSFGPVPLLVIAAARPELVQRRPGWGSGLPQATTITLDALSDEAVDSLLEHLLTERGPAPDGPGATVSDPPTPAGGGRPGAGREHIRMLLCLDRRMLLEPI